MEKIIKSVATLSFVGYLPASGTMATLATLPLIYFFSWMNFAQQLGIIFCLSAIGVFIIDKSLPYFSDQDPKQIVFDELVGTFITFFGISYHPIIFCAGFILFRLFDIFKPCGIKYLEKLPGAYGILADDCCAGLYANLILRFLFL